MRRLPALLALAPALAMAEAAGEPAEECVVFFEGAAAMSRAEAASYCSCLYSHEELQFDPSALEEINGFFRLFVGYAAEQGIGIDEVMTEAATRDGATRELRRAREEMIGFLEEAGKEAGCGGPPAKL